MSRIGKLPVVLSDKAQATVSANNITLKGPLGELSFNYHESVNVKQEGNEIIVSPKDDLAGAMWGTTRAIINNMFVGVTEGYKKSLEVTGVGYKFEVQGNKLVLSLGFSHKVEVDVPTGLKAAMDEKEKNVMHITGIDKQLVGEFTAKIRAMKKPEPYKGKGIKYVGEHIRRKAGKTGK
ncbi:MAG: 50S ribosomal protein L6 [Candidatus Gracilibacteria bacterium]|nr:50S ribosomal protein L6 [Candidatus Gracilibacteria bacterium]